MNMDMGGMSMDGGMDGSSDGMFKGTNMAIVRLYWYLVAGFVGMLALRRFFDYRRRVWGENLSKRRPGSIPSRPGNLMTQVYDTTISIFRELSYPQPIRFSGSFSKYFTPPPLGQCLLLVVYWTTILIFLWSNVILEPDSPNYAYKWEIVGFRAAWVSVTQLPLVYCLSCKVNVISIITGISYERLNWLHRWVARTLFLTIIVHWSFFFREWSLANFVSLEISMMPMVKYGFGAWSVIGWMVMSSFGFLRAARYELFVLQHLASAGILLWLIHVHVPSYASYNVWLAIGFVVFDRIIRTISFTGRNLHLFSRIRGAQGRPTAGYRARLTDLSEDDLLVKIKDIDFSWRPGQHIYICIPSLAFIAFHPFSIANCRNNTGDETSQSIDLYIKAHSGFTRRMLQEAADPYKSAPTGSLRTFISGPWGTPPSVTDKDTVIFIGASSGASFTVPIFQDLAKKPLCVRKIRFHWLVRPAVQLSWFSEQILSAAHAALLNGVDVHIGLHVTGPKPSSHEIKKILRRHSYVRLEELATPSSSSFPSDEKDAGEIHVLSEKAEDFPSKRDLDLCYTSSASSAAVVLPSSCVTISTHGRPSFDSLILPTVEQAHGETAIIACGGLGFTADLRNYVSGLSDERAIHKGTGAQGLSLFTETFGW